MYIYNGKYLMVFLGLTWVTGIYKYIDIYIYIYIKRERERKPARALCLAAIPGEYLQG